MKLKSIAITVILALCAGAAIYGLVKTHQEASAQGGDDEDNTPTVVTVQVGTLRRLTLHRYLESYGTVEPAPATSTEPAAGTPLASPTAGVVAQVNVAAGQEVKKGDLVVELNSGTTTAAYAEQELARQKELYQQHNTSLKNLQAAEAQLAELRVVAPFSGTVTRLNVRPGQAVDVNTVVAELVNMNRLAVACDLPVSQAHELNLGDELRVVASPPATTTVSFISPAVDTNTSTVAVWGGLPPNSGLRPGQFVPVRIVTAVHTNTLAAPQASVVTDIEGQSVISLVQGDEAIQQPVTTGFSENGWVEVAGPGLQAGQKVVTVGAYGLPKKTKINVVKAPAKETAAANSSSSQSQ